MSTRRLIYLIKHFLVRILTQKSPTKFKWIRPYQQSWWERNWLNTLYLSLAFLIGGVIILGLVYGYNSYLTIMYLKDAKELERWGRFSDHVSGLANSFFYSFGFLLLVFTILIQVKEMRYFRKILGISAQQQYRQTKLQKHQKFDSLFFKLLQLHHRNANGLICHETRHVLLGGRQCFISFYEMLKASYHKKQQTVAFSSNLSYVDLEKEIIRKTYQEFYQAHQEKLGYYFHNLYHIIEFLENNYPKAFERLNDKTKKDYIIILRSQFSSHELALIFYHGLYLWYEFGQQEFFNAIENYLLLEDLQKTLLFKRIHYEFYPQNAHYNPWLYEGLRNS